MRQRKRTILQGPPDRTMHKPEATRHLIHSAIRLTMSAEDPFAIHLLIQAASNLLRDVAKQTGRPLVVDFLEKIRPEFRDEVKELLDDLYNFLKHGIRDFKQGVGIRNVAERNTMELMFCILNHNALHNEYTEHMQLHMFFVQMWRPYFFEAEAFQPLPIQMAGRIVSGMTPRQFLSAILSDPTKVYQNFLQERIEDTKDGEVFYDTPFSRSNRTDS